MSSFPGWLDLAFVVLVAPWLHGPFGGIIWALYWGTRLVLWLGAP